MTRLSGVGGVLLLVFAYGCSGTPTSPSVAPESPVVPSAVVSPAVPPGVGPSLAQLAVSTFTATRRAVPVGDFVYYDVLVRLIETTGKSAATLTNVALSIPGSTDIGCASQRRPKVGPGATWDMDSLGYCAPEVALHKSVDTYVSSIALDVTYEDDFGGIGTLSVVVATN
jgi:hypothetical protein